MLKFRTNTIFLLSLSILAPAPVTGAPPKPVTMSAPASTPLDKRIQQLIPVLNDKAALADVFTPSFLAAIPPAQIKALANGFTAQYGPAQRIGTVMRNGPNNATVLVEYEKAVATVELTVEASPPHRIAGLLIKGFTAKNDDIDRIKADFAALPGSSGFVVQRLSDRGGTTISEVNGDRQFATGSTFKLYILAELAAQVTAGQRKWSDIVQLGVRNHSSVATQGWPLDTPVTLQTLATWMISVSDNAATDALMRELSRDAIEGKLASIGHSAPDRALPMLTTIEAFALKTNPLLRARFEKANEAGQRDLLKRERAALTYPAIDMSRLGSGPVAIDTVEWSASPADTARLLDNLRRVNDPIARRIMAVNSGIGPAAAAKWGYLGYKGGSEPGVISMSFLAQSKAGNWFAISGSWNDAAKEVDDTRFVQLMTRLVDSVAGG